MDNITDNTARGHDSSAAILNSRSPVASIHTCAFSLIVRFTRCLPYFDLQICLPDFMVVPITFNSTNALGDGACKGPIKNLKIEAINNLTLGNIFLKLCKACQIKTMSSIPPSAFSAGRIREAQHENRDMKLSNTSKGKETTKFFNTAFVELSPMKYISKLMNSIWGRYNRYSPHNVKKINDALVFHAEAQQSPSNATNMNEAMISLPSAKLDNVWAAINIPQSH